jgi:hypothetical protein
VLMDFMDAWANFDVKFMFDTIKGS